MILEASTEAQLGAVLAHAWSEGMLYSYLTSAIVIFVTAKKLKNRAISAAEFKSTCLALMDEVESQQSQIVITKHRKPVAMLVPIAKQKNVPFLNRNPDWIQSTGDLLSPLAPDWEIGDDI